MVSRKLSALVVLLFALLAPKLTFATTPEDHVFYLGTNQHVYDVWHYDPSTGPMIVDATSQAGAPVAAPDSPFAAYFIDFEEFVYYVTNGGHLGLLYLSNGKWYYDDLTVKSGAPPPDCASTPPTCTAATTQLVGFNDGGTPYVYYLSGTDVIEVYGSGSNVWAWDSPSSQTGAPPAELEEGNSNGFTLAPLTGFIIHSERLIYYVEENCHIGEMYNNGAGWVYLDITAAAGAQPASCGGSFGLSSLSGFSYGLQSHVYYVTGNAHVHQLYENSGSAWSDTDLTASAGAPLVAYPWALASFSYNSRYHVFYVSPYTPGYGLVNDLYATVNTDTWATQQAGPGALAVSNSPLTGFNNTGSNIAYIFFISENNYIVYGTTDSNTWADFEYASAPVAASGSGLGSCPLN